MLRTAVRICLGGLLLTTASIAWSETTIDVEINRDAEATGDFRFEKIPVPSTSDAGNAAKLKVVAGRRDGNGGQIRALTDGKLPANEDDPGRTFFLAAGADGGRLLADLGKPTTIQRINSYSWHPGSRGSQVYAVYGDDLKRDSFDVASATSEDLTTAGWKLLAKVDTRPKEGDFGGQHGVSIRDSMGQPIGEHRHLLFIIENTENETPFGQTFFGEIDVDDGSEHAPPVAVAPEVVHIGEKYQITFDASDAPELKPWIDETLKPICMEWYPKIVEMLPSEGYAAPERFTIYFHADMPGVAHATGAEIHCAAPWFSQNLDGEAAGAVVHEMVHIVQQYGRTRGERRNPGWMVEGLADYIRWHLYEPAEKRRTPNPDRANYTDSYQTTAAFLAYVVAAHDVKLIEKFNAAMRNGKFDDKLWEESTGKSVDELWAEYVRTLQK